MDGFRPGGEPRPCPPSSAVHLQGDDDAVFGPVAAEGAAELGGHGAVDPLAAEAALYRLAWNTSVLRDAADSMRALSGVTSVSNKVAIKPRPNAGDIKAHIMSALTRSWFEPEHVDLTGSNGKVTLTGKVNSWSERAMAGTTAWAAPFVSAVVNDIRVSQGRAHLCLKCEKPRPKDRGF